MYPTCIVVRPNSASLGAKIDSNYVSQKYERAPQRHANIILGDLIRSQLPYFSSLGISSSLLD